MTFRWRWLVKNFIVEGGRGITLNLKLMCQPNLKISDFKHFLLCTHTYFQEKALIFPQIGRFLYATFSLKIWHLSGLYITKTHPSTKIHPDHTILNHFYLLHSQSRIREDLQQRNLRILLNTKSLCKSRQRRVGINRLEFWI